MPRTTHKSTKETFFPLRVLALILVSLVIINLGYCLKGSFHQLKNIPFYSGAAARMFPDSQPPYIFRDSWLGELPTPVPYDLVRGLDMQEGDFETPCAQYLRGEIQYGGWWYFYFYVLLVKTPGSLIVLTILSVVLVLLRYPGPWCWRSEIALYTPVILILAVASSMTGMTVHFRYVLPILPFLIISASKVAVLMQRLRLLAIAPTLVLLGWGIVSCLRVFPHELSFVNEWAGGPIQGPLHVVESPIDWGQDLLYLRDWLKQNPTARPLRLAYYGFIDPMIYDIEYEAPPIGPGSLAGQHSMVDRLRGPQPGWYAVSVTLLQGLPSQMMHNGHGQAFGAARGDFAYFQLFRPIARAGYSIYIYQITLIQANAVRERLGMTRLSDNSIR